jgi:hypothetical protein
MGILYKNKEDVTTSVDIVKKDGSVEFVFSSDCGKHGMEEMLDGYKLTPSRLLEILQSKEVDFYTEDEIDF